MLLADIYFAATSYQADLLDNLMPRWTMLIIVGGCLTLWPWPCPGLFTVSSLFVK